MTCKCGSDRIVSINGKVSDMCSMRQGDVRHEGCVIDGMGIGSGDYLKFSYCLDCGRIQGFTPVADLVDAIEDYTS